VDTEASDAADGGWDAAGAKQVNKGVGALLVMDVEVPELTA